MKIVGKYSKEANYWISEIPFINIMDQGKTKAQSLKMIKSAIEELINRPDFTCKVEDLGHNEFVVSADNSRTLCCFILRRLREAQGLSIREVAEQLGSKSHTEYARHESGKTAMAFETFNHYVEVISEKEIFIKIA